jgi:hypothetical protein
MRATLCSCGLLLVLAACKDQPSNAFQPPTVFDAQPVVRIAAPPDAGAQAGWAVRDLSEAKDASGKAPFTAKIELPTNATVVTRLEGGTTPVADLNAFGVSFTMQELDRPGTFESVKKTIEPGRLLLAEKEKGGHTFMYVAADGSGGQIVSVTRGKILCGAGGLDEASSQVVLRACRSIKP